MSSSSRDIRNTALSAEELRRDRVQHAVVLRKLRKDEQLTQKRNIQPSDFEEEEEYDPVTLAAVNSKICNNDSVVLLGNCFENMTNACCTKQSQVESAQIARQIMKNASSNKSDTDKMINMIVQNQSLLKKMVLVLGSEHPDFDDVTKCECARIFCTILSSGSTEQIDNFHHLGGLDSLILALRSTANEILAKNCITAIGNFIGDGPQRKIIAIEKQVIPALLGLVKRFRVEISVLTALSWVLANLCRNTSSNSEIFSQLHGSVQSISYLILLNEDKIVENACYALEYLIGVESYDPNQGVEAIFQTGIGPRLISLLNHQNPWIILRTLAVVGNILYIGEEQAQRLIDMGAIPQLVRLLEHSNEPVVKEATWSISNISAGSQHQIDFIFESGAIPFLVKILHTANQIQTKKEAVWSLTHLARTWNPALLKTLIDNSMLQSFCHLLTLKHIDKNFAHLLMKGLHRMLWQSKKIGTQELRICLSIIEECGGVQHVLNYEYDPNDDVHYYASRILDFVNEENLTETDSDFD